MTPLETTLARSLAEAVKEASFTFELYKTHNLTYTLPHWYQPAVEALADFEEQRDLEKNLINY
jgi:hypothetical protein